MTHTNWTDEDCNKLDELLDKLSGKHSLHLLAVLALRGERSFGDLKRDMAPISPKVLSNCLSQLKSQGFITNRKTLEGRVKKSYYSITQKDKFLKILLSFREYA